MQMEQLIENFPNQIKRAIEIGESAQINSSSVSFNHIFISGLGGSGIGGTIFSQIVADELSIPILVNKDYSLPAYIGEKSLVIICSYSGNTEETLEVLRKAKDKAGKIICITSGGAILDFAKENNYDYIVIDGGMPPRSCFAYSFVQLFYVLNGLGLINADFKIKLEKSAALLLSEQHEIKTLANQMAIDLKDSIPVIYSDASYEGVGIRFRQQINENSKMLCWHHVIPEMNHNELVGWRGNYPNVKAVFLRNESDFIRNQERMEFLKEVIEPYCAGIYEINSKGESNIERTFYLIHFVDWISQYLGVMNGFDTAEIDVINKLKGSLAANPL
jgi:glucose/mannose-6-phosphate isomerase